MLCFAQKLMRVCVVLSLAMMPMSAGAFEPAEGDIFVIPALSRPSVKNGETVTISAVVHARRGVAKVEAEIVRKRDLGLERGKGLATLELKPAGAGVGGISPDGTRGLWTAQWTGAGLEATYYCVALTVTDRAGKVHRDKTLTFSDPIAGEDEPGTNAYGNGALQSAGATARNIYNPQSGFLDPVRGGIYFTGARQANYSGEQYLIVKALPGERDNAPEILGSVNDPYLFVDAIIDAEGGYGYFSDVSGHVSKFRLRGGTDLPTYMGSTGEYFSTELIGIDHAQGYGFGISFVTFKQWALNGNNVPVPAKNAWLMRTYDDALMDTAGGYFYFCERNHGYIGKLSLVGGPTAPGGETSPGIVAELDLTSETQGLLPVHIDAAAGYGWFVSTGLPAKVFKLNLGSGDAAPSLLSILTLEVEDGTIGSRVVTGDGAYALLGTSMQTPAKVVKIKLGSGGAAPTRIGAVSLEPEEQGLVAGGYDAPSGAGIFASKKSGRLIKVNAGAGDAPPTRLSASPSTLGIGKVRLALTDPYATYAVLITETDSGVPAMVYKISLGDEEHLPEVLGTPMTLISGQQEVLCGLLDATGGYLYLSVQHDPGVIVKFAMGNPQDAPRPVGATFFNALEKAGISAVIDRPRNHGYFGTNQNPARVVKMALGSGDALPTRLGAEVLESGELSPFTAVLDEGTGYAYFGTNTSPGKVVKVALGAGTAEPQRIGAVTLNPGENFPFASVIHPWSGFALFGTYTSPAKIVKVGLGEGDVAPTRIGAVTLESGENLPGSALIDPLSNRAFFGTLTNPGRVVAIDMDAPKSPPTRAGGITLEPGENLLPAGILNTATNTALFATSTQVTRLHRLLIAQAGMMKMTRFTLPERGQLQALSFYSHFPAGSVRLALYREAPGERRELVWESATTPNAVNQGFLEIPITAGTPDALTLDPGIYYFGWQVDTTANVPSFKSGAAGDGAYRVQEYGPFPSELNGDSQVTGWTPTNEVWTGYIQYISETGADAVWLRVGKEE